MVNPAPRWAARVARSSSQTVRRDKAVIMPATRVQIPEASKRRCPPVDSLVSSMEGGATECDRTIKLKLKLSIMSII